MNNHATAQTEAAIARFRRMRASDDDSFRALLRAVYADTYSHRELYATGGYARFVRANRALLFGEFDDAGDVVGHVAFFRKDPLGDYLEQGMALRHPHKKSSADRAAQDASYREIIAQVAQECFFVHQNVTTQHPLAQRFAARKFGARAAGFIIDFAVHQSLRAFGVQDERMSALVMTAAVRPPAPQIVPLPDTPWGRYVALIYRGLGLPRQIAWVRAAASTAALATPMQCFEANPNLGLMRRVLSARRQLETGPVGVVVGPRIDLVHVPLAADFDVAAAFTRLLGEGYLPVAVRPHARRPDEVVFQALAGQRPVQALAEVKLADAADRALVTAWLEAYARG